MTLHKFKRNIIAGLLLTAIAGASCTKLHDFGDLNQDPTAATAPIPSALLSNVLTNMAAFTWDAGGITTISGLDGQYFSETQYTDISTYAKQSLGWDDYFASPTANTASQVGYLNNLQTIINYNTNASTAAAAAAYGSNNNQIAIARILKVYIYSTLTDIYGDIPYFNALKKDNGLVAYDKQQAIYADFFKELTAAVAQFDGGLSVSGDILFSGSATKWKKFANSIHALLALNLSKVDAATGKKEFAAAIAGGVFAEGEDVSLVFPGGNFLSPVYKYYDVTKRFDYAVSAPMTNWLSANNDPRGGTNVYGTSSVGFPVGLSRNDAVAFANTHVGFAQLTKGAAGSAGTDPFPVLMAGEIYLARAEAAQLGWTAEDAAAMYSLGIKSSWEYWKVYDATKFANYMASASINLGAGSPLQKICTQEWVSHYPAGLRGWSVFRRTGYPALAAAPAAVNGGVIPRRIAYGPNEYSYNAANTNTVATQYTVSGDKDSQIARMWWDIQ
jgi:hypothetical protein